MQCLCHLNFLSALVPTMLTDCGLLTDDQFLLVLMKLKLAVPNQDLAYRFGIHVTKVSKIFHQWIDIMSREMKQFVCWPDRDLIQQT